MIILQPEGVELKVGMKVWTLLEGWSEIIAINEENKYPILTNLCSYTADGKQVECAIHRSLFLNEIDMTPPMPPTKKVEVWDWLVWPASPAGSMYTSRTEDEIVNEAPYAKIRQRIDGTGKVVER